LTCPKVVDTIARLWGRLLGAEPELPVQAGG
jgi:hypothetical protein